MAQVVYQNIPSATVADLESNGLFAGKTFWLSRAVPQRQTFIDKVKSNGGSIIDREAEADFRIGDHLKAKAAAPGCLSFTYIDACINAGELLASGPHLIHATEGHRAPGSGSILSKSTRVPFTPEDDRILIGWITGVDTGALGNKIYQDLETKYPHHTWQSWRDRYVKGRANWARASVPAGVPAGTALSGNTAAVDRGVKSPEPVQIARGPSEDASINENKERTSTSHVLAKPLPISTSPQPLHDLAGEARGAGAQQGLSASPVADKALVSSTSSESHPAITVRTRHRHGRTGSSASDSDIGAERSFTFKEYRSLLNVGKFIIQLHADCVDEAWEEWASKWPRHSSVEWREYWEDRVRPDWLRQNELQTIDSTGNSDEDSESDEVLEPADKAIGNLNNRGGNVVAENHELESNSPSKDLRKHAATNDEAKSSRKDDAVVHNEIPGDKSIELNEMQTQMPAPRQSPSTSAKKRRHGEQGLAVDVSSSNESNIKRRKHSPARLATEYQEKHMSHKVSDPQEEPLSISGASASNPYDFAAPSPSRMASGRKRSSEANNQQNEGSFVSEESDSKRHRTHSRNQVDLFRKVTKSPDPTDESAAAAGAYYTAPADTVLDEAPDLLGTQKELAIQISEDGNSSSSDEFETAQHDGTDIQMPLEGDLEEQPERSKTQSFIDAQIMFEMRSAIQQDHDENSESDQNLFIVDTPTEPSNTNSGNPHDDESEIDKSEDFETLDDPEDEADIDQSSDHTEQADQVQSHRSEDIEKIEDEASGNESETFRGLDNQPQFDKTDRSDNRDDDVWSNKEPERASNLYNSADSPSKSLHEARSGFKPAAFQSSPSRSRHSLTPKIVRPPEAGKDKSGWQRTDKHYTNTSPTTHPSRLISDASETETIESEDVVDLWREAHAQQGTPFELVKIAYRAATGDLALAEQVLDALIAGLPIPADLRGVWTLEEDFVLKQGAERELTRVVKKHGMKLYKERLEFLELFDGGSEAVSDEGENASSVSVNDKVE